ncbi:hypothetical protein BDR03DRAFT_1013234 [Suillus americanus]|nr:hypothetical protein BDR03DRAFT_1013234 [Suillus americanus]
MDINSPSLSLSLPLLPETKNGRQKSKLPMRISNTLMIMQSKFFEQMELTLPVLLSMWIVKTGAQGGRDPKGLASARALCPLPKTSGGWLLL